MQVHCSWAFVHVFQQVYLICSQVLDIKAMEYAAVRFGAKNSKTPHRISVYGSCAWGIPLLMADIIQKAFYDLVGHVYTKRSRPRDWGLSFFIWELWELLCLAALACFLTALASFLRAAFGAVCMLALAAAFG